MQPEQASGLSIFLGNCKGDITRLVNEFLIEGTTVVLNEKNMSYSWKGETKQYYNSY